jgi:hypothetical protein
MGFEVLDTESENGHAADVASELVRNRITRPSQVRLPVALQALMIKRSTG